MLIVILKLHIEIKFTHIHTHTKKKTEKLFNIYQVYKNTLKTHFGHTACQVNAKLESEASLINY